MTDADLYQLDAVATHAAVNGEPLWQTPDPFSREALLIQSLRGELDAAYDKVRFWRYAYITCCVQFFVVCVAAVWAMGAMTEAQVLAHMDRAVVRIAETLTNPALTEGNLWGWLEVLDVYWEQL